MRFAFTEASTEGFLKTFGALNLEIFYCIRYFACCPMPEMDLTLESLNLGIVPVPL